MAYKGAHRWLTCYNPVNKTLEKERQDERSNREGKGTEEEKEGANYPLPNLIDDKQAEWNDEDWDEDFFGAHFRGWLIFGFLVCWPLGLCV